MTDEVVPRLGASRQREAEGRRFIYSAFPLAACPVKRNVLGNSPSPQILNDPKSLYQGPSGASGSDSRHSLSLYRSSARICRSATRSNKCCLRLGGRFVHRIFGINHRMSSAPVRLSIAAARRRLEIL